MANSRIANLRRRDVMLGSGRYWKKADGDMREPPVNIRFSNRPFGVKHFQTIRRCSVDVAHRLVLLFGIGTRALPSWDSKTRWNDLMGGLAVSCRQVQADMRTHLIHRPARDIIPPLGGFSSYLL